MHLLGQDDLSHKFLSTVGVEVLLPRIVIQIIHNVQDRVYPQDFVLDIGHQHHARLVLQNGGDKSRPDLEPIVNKAHYKYRSNLATKHLAQYA